MKARRVMIIALLISSTALTGCGEGTPETQEMKPVDTTPFDQMKDQMIANVKKTNRNIKLPAANAAGKNGTGK